MKRPMDVSMRWWVAYFVGCIIVNVLILLVSTR